MKAEDKVTLDKVRDTIRVSHTDIRNIYEGLEKKDFEDNDAYCEGVIFVGTLMFRLEDLDTEITNYLLG